MHYYQFNIGDYASHTKGLSLYEDLAYRRLMDEYYLSEQALNGCSTDVARCIGMREQQQEVDYVLQRFFKNEDGKWTHKRIEKEIFEFHSGKESKSKAGKASAEARRIKAFGHPLQQNSTGVEQTLNSVQLTKNQEPITNNHKPITKNQIKPTDADASVSAKASPLPDRPSQKISDTTKSGRTWNSYADAYLSRYGVEPVRNAKTTAAMAQLVDRLGADDAPEVAAFYVHHQNSRYVASGHAPGNLLQDAEKLRTEWATGRRVTQTQARQADRSASNGFVSMLEGRS